ncbi:RidA family protein [Paludibaculum fermentans]|uniref:RidA family protein n=1 Tax=Paludibaculum fermentans TaxID=1473598 RepID=A0A7S7SIH3_PALFE|nr:RidA family protein [Paludibaculum fermentans]QOY84940.1 RidA family protein [Paludibaculum fermentans]
MRYLTLTFLLAAVTGILQAQTEFPKAAGVAPAAGYSHVVVTSPGKLVFLAGQIANNASGQLVGKDDIKAQTEQVFENIKANLAAAGATFQDVVKLNWYIRDLKPEYLPVVREVRDRYVNKEHPPASTLVGVSALFREGYMLEVEAVASIPAGKGAK